MQRYMLRLSYIGTAYRGSQKHSNRYIMDLDSVQGAIESTLRKLDTIKNVPNLVMAGRTDAGVHALNTSAHIDLEPKNKDSPIDCNYLVQMMNRILIHSNHEIRILSCHRVSPKFHARYAALNRSYIYRIAVAKDTADYRFPIAENARTLHFRNPAFEIEKLKKGANLFSGNWDFTSFSSKSHNKIEPDNTMKRYVRTMDLTVTEAQPLMPFDPLSDNFSFWHLNFTSRSFLYNQIRRMTGALLALAIDVISENDIYTMLRVPSHYSWNPKIQPALPHGLYFKSIEYNPEDIKEIES